MNPALYPFNQHPALVAAAHDASAESWLQPGDHVSVSRGAYDHHAIYIGNGVLVEFGNGLLGGPVDYVDHSAYSRGTRLTLVRRGGRRAVERAESQLGRNDFNLATRNCEHFATWCSTGHWRSTQVRNAAIGGACAVVLALLLIKLG